MIFNTADDAFSYIESFTNLEKSPNLTAREYRLDRMYSLVELFDNPQNTFKSIHVAGSKGKGSTSAFIAAVLNANGLKTGLYCSPHVESYKERISAAGTFFDDSLYAETASMMISRIGEQDISNAFPGGEPTTFELLTLLSFLIFRKAGCEWAVFETGLGGRLDATNVIIPEASVLTIIELEHTEYLGNTITEVAGEKAGIIKRGVPVFSACQTKDAEIVFRERAKQQASSLFFPENLIKEITPIAAADYEYRQSSKLEFKSGSTYILQLLSAGKFQMENASLAVSCLEYLRNCPGSSLPQTFNPAIGISRAALPGRMEIFMPASGRPIILLDGAHTIRSVQSASEAFFDIICEENLSTSDTLLLFGAVDGKNITGMAEILCPLFKNIIISTPGSFKKSNPDTVFETFRHSISSGTNLILEKDPSKALDAALKHNHPVFVTGSFYMVAEIRKHLL